MTQVYVAIDGQQFVAVNKTTVRVLGVETTTIKDAYGYYSVSTVYPPYALSSGGAVIRVTGNLLDNNQGGACRFFTSNGTLYAPATVPAAGFVECVTPKVPDGNHNISVSLDSNVYAYTARDYSLPDAKLYSYPTPVVLQAIPTRGYSTGGTTVSVIGTGFWNSPLIKCKFGPLIAPTAVFFNTTMVICTTPPSNDTVPVEVTFNAQQFSNNSVQYVNYRRPVVASIFPKRVPADTTEFIVITGLYFKSFEMGITCLFVSPRGNAFVKGIEWGPNLEQIRCQAPPSSGGTFSLIYVSIDGIQFSTASMPLFHYDLTGLSPFTGPITGGTVITVGGSYLSGESAPSCQFIAQKGLSLVGTTNLSIYSAIVNAPGSGFLDGAYNLSLGACYDSFDVVSDIEIVSITGGYLPDGKKRLDHPPR